MLRKRLYVTGLLATCTLLALLPVSVPASASVNEPAQAAVAVVAPATAPPPSCGNTPVPAGTSGCQLSGPVIPGATPDLPVSRGVGVSVSMPSPLPVPDCATAPPGSQSCAVYLAKPSISGVGALGWAGGPDLSSVLYVDAQGNCTGQESCAVTVRYLTTGIHIYPYVEVSVTYQIGTAYTISLQQYPVMVSTSFLVPAATLPNKTGITGRVVRGPVPNHATSPTRPAAGVVVKVSGPHTSVTTTTGADGT